MSGLAYRNGERGICDWNSATDVVSNVAPLFDELDSEAYLLAQYLGPTRSNIAIQATSFRCRDVMVSKHHDPQVGAFLVFYGVSPPLPQVGISSAQDDLG